MSTQFGTYFLGTYGFPIAVKMGADLTGATAVNIKLTKPDGSVVNRDLTTTAVTDAPGGIVTYRPISSEVDQVGGYAFEIKVDVGSTKRLVSDGKLTITQDPNPSSELILEDGTGRPDANSYASVAEGDAYYAKHLYGDVWVSSDVKAKALMMATRIIDTNVEFNGYRVGGTQALMWPRIYVPDPEGYPGSPLQFVGYGPYLASNAVPKRVKDATCELALSLLGSDRTKDFGAKGISRIGLGQGAISVDFNTNVYDRPQIFPDLVATMLIPLGRIRYRSAQARVRKG